MTTKIFLKVARFTYRITLKIIPEKLCKKYLNEAKIMNGVLIEH